MYSQGVGGWIKGLFRSRNDDRNRRAKSALTGGSRLGKAYSTPYAWPVCAAQHGFRSGVFTTGANNVCDRVLVIRRHTIVGTTPTTGAVELAGVRDIAERARERA